MMELTINHLDRNHQTRITRGTGGSVTVLIDNDQFTDKDQAVAALRELLSHLTTLGDAGFYKEAPKRRRRRKQPEDDLELEL